MQMTKAQFIGSLVAGVALVGTSLALAQPTSSPCYDLICDTQIIYPPCESGIECDDEMCGAIPGDTWDDVIFGTRTTQCSNCTVGYLNDVCVLLTCGPRMPFVVDYDFVSGTCSSGGGGEE